MKAQFSMRHAQNPSYDCELNVFSNAGEINLRLIFDAKNKFIVVRKRSWPHGRNELAIYDDFVSFTEW